MPFKENAFLIILSICTSFLCCLARPDGAPKSACSSLTPVHSGIQPQRTSSPYSISVYKNTDNKVRVKIFSPVGEDIAGFILQARESKNKNKLIEGRFSPTEGISKTIDCFTGKENTLVHVNPSAKSEVVTEWLPTSSVDEDVVFRATVAKSYAFFYTEVDSAPLRIVSREKANTPSPSSSKQDDSTSMYKDCFLTKGCMGLPSGCVSSEDCEVLLSYMHSGLGISFTLQGFLDNLMYMAMGLSNDAVMGDDLVTECFRENIAVRARESWNRGKSNLDNRELPGDSFDGSFKNGITSCSWRTKYLKEASNGQIFDLANKTYYILLAKGPINERNERLGYHSARIASREPVNFTAFEIISANGVDDAIKIHGTFMLTAFVFFMSFGILLARHFKNAFDSKELCNVKIWFALHRGFMISALILMCIAFIVIFVFKGGYETSNHSVIGCITIAFSLTQPIMAAFRPAPDHKYRVIFNWLHFLVGNSAYILAIVTIYFAVSLESSGLKDNFYYVLSAFVILHVIFHLLFQVQTWTSGRKRNNEVKMLDMSAAPRANNMQNNIPEKNLADHVLRCLLLGLYAIFLVVIMLAMYTLIGIA